MAHIYLEYTTLYNVLFSSFNPKEIFRKRDDSGERRYCVYLWMYRGIIFYIGEGLKNRPFTHVGDLVANTIDSDWTCVILATNITKLEACIMEAKLLSLVENRTFTRRGQYVWDGVSLMNKQREYYYKGVSYRSLFKEYLNLNDGSNYWRNLRSKINNY